LDWDDELERWLEPFLGRLGNKTRRRMGPLYVAGLIGPGDRKSIQPMAKRFAPAPMIGCITSSPLASGTRRRWKPNCSSRRTG
jgi:hypothetical protein